MTTVDIRGPFSDAALASLFVDNAPPTAYEVVEARRDCQIYGEVCSRLIGERGMISGQYIREQPVFGPIVRILALAGWTLSGSGYFSVAFFKGGLALKIGLRPQDDLAYSYLQWCAKPGNADLPGVPKVYSMEQGDHAYAAVMDRYSSITGETDENCVLYDHAIHRAFEQIRMAVEHGYSGSTVESHTGTYIHREFAGKGQFDITEANVMIDRDGKLVITDPIASTAYTRSDDYSYSKAA